MVVMHARRENSAWSTSVSDQRDWWEVQLGGELFRQSSTRQKQLRQMDAFSIYEKTDGVVAWLDHGDVLSDQHLTIACDRTDCRIGR